MSFVGEVLKNVNGIQWYYITGIIIFITLFIIIVYRTYKIPKTELLNMKQSILDEDNSEIEKKIV